MLAQVSQGLGACQIKKFSNIHNSEHQNKSVMFTVITEATTILK